MNSEHNPPLNNKKKVYSITLDDLPLCCPMPNKQIWDSHPRIYLPIIKTGYINCPYCGAIYHLIEKSSIS